MDRGILFNLDSITVKFLERGNMHAALVDPCGRRQIRRLCRQRLITLEGHDDVLVSYKTLTCEPVARWHIVDLGIVDFRLRDLAELAKHLLFFLRQRDRVFAIAGSEMLDLDEAGPAFAVLTVERNWNFVGLGDSQDGSAVARDRID